MATRTIQGETQIKGEPAVQRAVNWPLVVGAILVLIIAILAIIGPSIAPKDPAEEKNITMIEGTWYIPPFDFGTPGYPLGSDSFGRDLLSRLLWGIRPTMIMVSIVAIVRLIIGVIIGLSAGWFTGKTDRLLNGLIQTALALPVLLVALGAIAIVGVELGIWAFIIGLSLTGWVDTALQVREQTRIIKGQVYVEAASALGSSHPQILSNHILKQIAPMLLMLFAFEISSTLMLTAGLGFLGYYIGGDVWVETDDFVARRISGTPELGQMLATSWVTLTKPWALVAVGTTIFITVLGFNLIGEGLRQNMGLVRVQRKGFLSEIQIRFGLWFENYLWHPLVQFFRIKPLRVGLAAVILFFLLSWGALFMLDSADGSNVSQVLAQFDQGILPTPEAGINDHTPSPEISTPVQQSVTYDPSIAWELYDQGGFTGGPAISGDLDRLYVASGDGIVYALDINGEAIWQAQLPSGGVGTPEVDMEGNIYVSDRDGGLNKFTSQGESIWSFQTEVGDRSISGPVIGPSGNIFYTVGTAANGFVQSVNSEGEGVWVTEAKTPLFYETPIPSADGEYVFLKNDIFSAESGELLNLDSDLEVTRYFTSENGLNYLLAGHKIIQWDREGNRVELGDIYEWDSSHFGDFATPVEVGVESDNISWQLYTTPGGTTSTIWVSADDEFLGTARIPISSSTLVTMQSDHSALVCGGGSFNQISTDCALVNPSDENPLWEYHFGNYGPVSGGVLLDDVYYLSTEEGYVFAIDENFESVEAVTGTTPLQEAASSPTDVGILWTYQASDHISIAAIDGPDGNLYLTFGEDKLVILRPDGEMANTIQLPAPPFQQTYTSGRDAPMYIPPQVLPDGTIIVITSENTIYAINSEGDILWEQELVAQPAEYPIQDHQGNLFVIDDDAGLNAFTVDGLKWRFPSAAADIPAHGAVVGPEGKFYYVVTNYSKGFIQAVSNDGELLWITESTTDDFYDPLQISSDGQFISLAENLVLTGSGELVEYPGEDQVDEFIFAANGQNYMRSLHTVTRWQYGPSGMEILSSGIVSEEDTTLRPPLESSADSKGIVWLYYPERYTGGGIIVAWMSPDGELLGNYLYDRSWEAMMFEDYERSMLTECRWFPETETMECNSYSPMADESIRTVQIPDVPFLAGGFLEDDILYLFSGEDQLSAVYLGEPALP